MAFLAAYFVREHPGFLKVKNTFDTLAAETKEPPAKRPNDQFWLRAGLSPAADGGRNPDANSLRIAADV
jgi:hypothetical protein